jgi:hypothetical protein
MSYPADPAKLKQWCDSLHRAVESHPEKWDQYDEQVEVVCNAYNFHLRTTPGYIRIESSKVKAILWTETGAANVAWLHAPMQIGVNGDPGLRNLLSTPQGRLILPESYLLLLNITNVPVHPALNIMAGVGYLMRRAAKFR